jgi:hypothetical protein
VPDYRRFLAAETEVVLPYFGGPFVEAADRRLRLTGTRPAPGFWRFTVRGRRAQPLAPAEPPDLSALPAVRGFAVRGYVVHERAERLALPPADEPLPFAAVIGRRWPSGELLDDGPDFDTGIEDAVRERFAARRTLAGLAGVPAALRAAYAYAVLLRVADTQGMPVRPSEARAQVADIADGGDEAALQVLMRLVRARAAARRAQPPQPPPVIRVDATADEHAEDRAAAALDAARAALRGTRRLAGGVLEVRYELDGEGFVSIVDAETLRVIDAGICLDGQDDRLTLHSLPGVVRQAMRDDVLNITAW